MARVGLLGAGDRRAARRPSEHRRLPAGEGGAAHRPQPPPAGRAHGAAPGRHGARAVRRAADRASCVPDQRIADLLELLHMVAGGRAPDTMAAVPESASARGAAVKPPSFRYSSPTTVPDAVALLVEHAEEDARVLAGGQSLVPLMNFRLAHPGLPGRPAPRRGPRLDPDGRRRPRHRRHGPAVGRRAERGGAGGRPAARRGPRARGAPADPQQRHRGRQHRPRRPGRRAAHRRTRAWMRR